MVLDTVGLNSHNYYVPGNNIPHALNSKVDIIKQSIEYYECRRVPIVQKANVVSGSPCGNSFLYLQFQIRSYENALLPTSFKLYDRKYRVYSALKCSFHCCCSYIGMDQSTSMTVYSHHLTCLKPASERSGHKRTRRLICHYTF